MTVTTHTTDLTARAREAYALFQVSEAHQAMQTRVEQIGHIRRALAELDITPADTEPLINAASGQICVPLVSGELRIEAGEGDEEGIDFPVQTHAVAAEWDTEARMVRLVADLDYDS